MRGVSPDGRNTVQGTFDDLSEEEKTRAYLQFLQYHQQLEQENETKRFQQMLNNDHRDLDDTMGNENDKNVVNSNWEGGINSSHHTNHNANIILILLFSYITVVVFHLE